VVTIHDVAAQAGVSIATVSVVLNNRPSTIRVSAATRERVRAAAAALGYVPNTAARALRTGGQPRTLLLYLGYQRSSHYISEALRGIQSALGAGPYRLTMEPYAAGALLAAIGRGVPPGTAGVLVIGTTTADDAALAEHSAPLGGRPLVLVGRPVPLSATAAANGASDLSAVTADQRSAAAGAVRHLLALGHRRIACLTRPPDSAAIADRLAGYHDALTQAGVRPAPELVLETEFNEAGGHRAAARVLGLPPRRRPTAIFAAGDVLALGAMQAARDAGLPVGTRLALVGFDDLPVCAYLDPPLTTVHLPVFELGAEAVRLLIGQIEGTAPRPAVRTLPAPLVVRGSSAVPAARATGRSMPAALPATA
jgi:LacI family transcriptional regulator